MKPFVGHGMDEEGKINGSENLRESYIVEREWRE